MRDFGNLLPGWGSSNDTPFFADMLDRLRPGQGRFGKFTRIGESCLPVPVQRLLMKCFAPGDDSPHLGALFER